ncbi:MAG: SprT-like domain-containing protein [Gammaproteobacteria bacterium]|nr:SprT-like domain-containing protein [Gammaproteobacteria bacterium]MDH5777235.1 SprT-like domain-containing protein [Gammaproteobacteria bacterium]
MPLADDGTLIYTMSFLNPINEQDQQLVIERTKQCISIASAHYQQIFPDIAIMFDLTGRAAGMYRRISDQRLIRYNPYVFAKYFQHNLANTIPHEVAHYITDVIYGLKNIRPHGKEWKSVMAMFGVEAKVTCSYDLTGIPTRRHRRFDYRCDCRTYEITTRRHNMILRGDSIYYCKNCQVAISQYDL